jgi:hypothetical protein
MVLDTSFLSAAVQTVCQGCWLCTLNTQLQNETCQPNVLVVQERCLFVYSNPFGLLYDTEIIVMWGDRKVWVKEFVKM